VAGQSAEATGAPATRARSKRFMMLAASVAYVVALKFIGMIAASALYLAFVMRYFERHAWWLVAVAQSHVPAAAARALLRVVASHVEEAAAAGAAANATEAQRTHSSARRMQARSFPPLTFPWKNDGLLWSKRRTTCLACKSSRATWTFFHG